MKKRLSLIVNPIAGIGGRVALKGSDGLETIQRARDLGATPVSPQRALEALKRLLNIKDNISYISLWRYY